MVPVPVIVPPVSPVPAVMEVTALPFDAEVRRPWASTVILARVYGPGVTAVLARATVPEVVIGPPVRPVPVKTVVTDPPPPVVETVTLPVEALREIPDPAVSVSTPLLVTVMDPVLASREIPDPAVRSCTPSLVIVTAPVFPLTEIPAPAKIPDTAPPPPPVTLITPSGLTVMLEVESTIAG
jgi:hypothetical protein